MTAVEKFHFGVQEYFIHTFQLPTLREDTKSRKGKEISLCWMELLQDLPSVFVSSVALYFCLCVCLKWGINEGEKHLFPSSCSPGTEEVTW